MGLFNVFCGLTGLPVRPNHQVVAVAFDELERDPGADHEWHLVRCIRRVMRGTYSGYGYLDEYEDDPDARELNDMRGVSLSFFHVAAWEETVSYVEADGIDWARRRLELGKEHIDPDDFTECCRVIHNGHVLGRNVAAVPLDDFSSQETHLAQQRRLLLVTRDMLATLYVDDEDEDEDEE